MEKIYYTKEHKQNTKIKEHRGVMETQENTKDNAKGTQIKHKGTQQKHKHKGTSVQT